MSEENDENKQEGWHPLQHNPTSGLIVNENGSVGIRGWKDSDLLGVNVNESSLLNPSAIVDPGVDGGLFSTKDYGINTSAILQNHNQTSYGLGETGLKSATERILTANEITGATGASLDSMGSIRINAPSVNMPSMTARGILDSWNDNSGILNVAPFSDYQVAKPEEQEQMSKEELLEAFKKQDESMARLYEQLEGVVEEKKQSIDVIQILQKQINELGQRTQDELLLLIKGSLHRLIYDPSLYNAADYGGLEKHLKRGNELKIFCPRCKEWLCTIHNLEELKQSLQQQRQGDPLKCPSCVRRGIYSKILLFVSDDGLITIDHFRLEGENSKDSN